MMRIDILTVMPEALESPLHCSIVQRAQDKGLVEIHVHNLREIGPVHLSSHTKKGNRTFTVTLG